MTSPQAMALSPTEASARIQHELQEAQRALHSADLELALDRFVTALGLALQLGPATTERVLAGVWAEFASALGALVGQVGMTLTMTSDHRSGVMKNARTRAMLLDDASGSIFALADWIDQVAADLQSDEPDPSPTL